MKDKTPILRIAKRETISNREKFIIKFSAIIFALLVGALIFIISGANPIQAYSTMITGTFLKKSGIKQFIKITIPLLGTGLALAPCFKMKYWNIGAEGQITMGAIGASFFAINYGDVTSSPILLLEMALGSIIMGMLWAMIPALFKARWGTNETLFTLMLNYIAIGIVGWLQDGPWEGKEGSQVIPNFNENAVLPKVFGIHIGWIVVLVVMVFMYIYLNYTKHGYEISVLGDSINTARYAGMDVTKIIVRTAMLSGGICGLVGFLMASGDTQSLYQGIADGVGFTAITVAWLSNLNPFIMLVISMLLALLTRGASSVQTALNVPASISDIFTGIILMSLLGCEFFINYKVILKKEDKKNA